MIRALWRRPGGIEIDGLLAHRFCAIEQNIERVVADEIARTVPDEDDGAHVVGFRGIEVPRQLADGGLVHHAVIAHHEFDDTHGLTVTHGVPFLFIREEASVTGFAGKAMWLEGPLRGLALTSRRA